MSIRRRVAVAGTLVACLLLATGTGGFSSVEAERGVSVDVVGDENAYMSLVYPDDVQEVDHGDNSVYLTVRNQFSQRVNATVTADAYDVDGGLTVDPDELDAEIGVGDQKSLAASFECDSNGTKAASISFDVAFDGASVSAKTTSTGKSRTVDFSVRCSTNQMSNAGAPPPSVPSNAAKPGPPEAPGRSDDNPSNNNESDEAGGANAGGKKDADGEGKKAGNGRNESGGNDEE